MKKMYIAFNMALGMFTSFPLKKNLWDEKCAKYIMRVYPFVGLLVGVEVYIFTKVMLTLNLNIMLTSSLIIIAPFLFTGLIHLDGFMDVCDGILCRKNKEERIRVLKDSKVGAFSVISLMFLLLINFSTMYSFLDKGGELLSLIFIPILSRALVGVCILNNDSIGESYYSKLFKDGTKTVDSYFLIGIIIIVSGAFYFIGNTYIIIPLAMCLVCAYLLKVALRAFGGINGDVAGYILIVSEAVAILALAII